MRKSPTLLLSACIISTALLSGCAGFKLCNYTFTVHPNNPELKNDSVVVRYTMAYPAKSIPKKGHAEIVPMLIMAVDTFYFPTLKVKGEKSDKEGKTLNYKEGGSVDYYGGIKYREGMENAELMVNGNGWKSKKVAGKANASCGVTPIAKGVNTTSKWAKLPDSQDMIMAGHNYGPVYKQLQASVYFPYNSAEFRKTQKNSTDAKDFIAGLIDFQQKGNSLLEARVTGYTSPEGADALNKKLSQSRADIVAPWLSKELKKSKPDFTFTPDIKGIQTELNQLKEYLIKELKIPASEVNSAMPADITLAELLKTFKPYKNEISTFLTPLRKTEMTAKFKLKEKSNEELQKAALTDPASLTYEELLYTAEKVITDEKNRLMVYQSARKVEPSDYRAYNNGGVTAAKLGDWTTAEDLLRMAEKVDPKNQAVKHNLGIIFLKKGDTPRAETYFTEAAGLPEAEQALCAMYIKQGKYEKAYGMAERSPSFNTALASVLVGKSGETESILAKSGESESARSHYLKAIAKARQNNKAGALNHLKEAFSKDNTLKEKALKDKEFENFRREVESLE